MPVVNYYTNTVWPGIRTICTQETISSRGAGPGAACQCHYKNPRDKDVGLEPYPATGDSMGYPEWSWWTLASFQTSCDNASVLKSVLNKSSWDYSISICSGDDNCFQYALPMFISLAGMCP